jgi:hypothetical protein
MWLRKGDVVAVGRSARMDAWLEVGVNAWVHRHLPPGDYEVVAVDAEPAGPVVRLFQKADCSHWEIPAARLEAGLVGVER